jgi:hypothetical protein
MVIVDALDEMAARFYEAHGFVRLPDSLRLVMPMRQAGVGPKRQMLSRPPMRPRKHLRKRI